MWALKTPIKCNGEQGSLTFRAGIQECPLYFDFYPMFGEEFIPSVALNKDIKVGCLAFIFIIYPYSDMDGVGYKTETD